MKKLALSMLVCELCLVGCQSIESQKGLSVDVRNPGMKEVKRIDSMSEIVPETILSGQAAVTWTADTSTRGPYHQVAKVGDYSRSEVEALRVAINKLIFPVPEHTIAKMLPRPVEAFPFRFVDGFVTGSSGIAGGNEVEYWLNDQYVLKVATAYHTEGEKHFSLEEWAVILTRDERDRYTRRIY